MKRVVIALALGLLGSWGCHGLGGGGNPGVVGMWTIDPEFAKAHQNDPPKGFMTGLESTYVFKFAEDHTFKGPMCEGTYVLDGTRLKLTTTKMTGSSAGGLQAPIAGELDPDTHLLTLHPPVSGMIPQGLHSGVRLVRN